MKTITDLDREYFWNKRTRAVVSELSNHFDHVIEASYINDSNPSILVNRTWRVYLPVRADEWREQTDFYIIMNDQTSEELAVVDTLFKAIDELEELIEKERNK